jgi:hypothetical protein
MCDFAPTVRVPRKALRERGIELAGTVSTPSAGRLFFGRYVATDQPIAVKLLDSASDDESAGPPMEVLALRELQHPHICRLLDYFCADTVNVLVMELHGDGARSRRPRRPSGS